jgi:hypothetical protein
LNRATDRDWLRRHPAPSALLVGLVFGAFFAVLIGIADTHGWRFAWISGLAIGIVLFAPYVWWRLRH